MDPSRASIPRLVAASAELDEPLWRIHERVTRLAPILEYGLPSAETTYLGLAYGDLLDESRKDAS